MRSNVPLTTRHNGTRTQVADPDSDPDSAGSGTSLDPDPCT